MADCCGCFETFAARAANPSRQDAEVIDQKEGRCRCQVVSVSAHSPGCVVGAEVLVRIVVAPQHVTKTGGPRSAALTDAERGGLSMFREHQASDLEIRSTAINLVAAARAANNEKAGVQGVLRIVCDTIRECTADEAEPVYCVYDTALPEIKSHVEAFQRVSQCPLEVQAARRQKLFTLVKATFVSASEFRDGLLADLAPQAG